MQIKAKAKYIKMSPKKVKLVIDAIRGESVQKAESRLCFLNKRACLPVLKLLKSAIANAENNFSLKKENLFIKEIRADGGPVLKRWIPRAHGRATPIRKRSTHISIVLDEYNPSSEIKKNKKEIQAPVKIEDLGNITKKQDDDKNTNKSKDKSQEQSRSNKKGFQNKMFQRKSF